MDVLFFLLPIALLLGFIGLAAMLWAAKSGQFEDLDGPAHRILYDDDQEMIPGGTPKPKPEEGGAGVEPTEKAPDGTP
ncbi:MAG: cbb3-type cytochrome oxidase assembly protein CcoS [Magnetococcales bacterium]|nr:cbb3-type cytochrome oxidase assembly protein CcoS [Magnetococcales bacterium]